MRARGPYLGSYQLDRGDIFGGDISHQKFLTSSTMFHFCESDTNQWNFPHLWDSYQIVREEKFIMRKVDTRAGLVKLWDQTSSLSDLAVVQFKIESSTFNILQHPLYCYTRRRRLKDRFDRIWTMLGTVHIDNWSQFISAAPPKELELSIACSVWGWHQLGQSERTSKSK